MTITADQSGTYVNGTRVIVTDIICSNGVIHIIDKVLVPSEVVV